MTGTSSGGADIAVIGLAARLPGADDAAAFWENLLRGVESIARYTPDELVAAGVPAALVRSPDYVPAKGAVTAADCFDAAFFGIPPRTAALMDPQHRLFLECAWQALEDAGYPAEPPGRRIGVFAGGAAMSSYYHEHLLAGVGEADPFQLFLLNQPAALPTQVAYRLNLTGPALALQTACSTGLAVVAVACQNLIDLQCDLALAGAVALSLPLAHGYRHREGSILSADGHCRPFDAAAGGTVPGNGVGVVVLKRLADALADGDRIDAVIRGYAMNNDGRAKAGFTAPSATGQAQAIADALAMAGLSPADIGYIEAHGTATQLGDAIEVDALRQVFAGVRAANCALGSVKGNIGHLDTAAGIAGFIKAVLALRHGWLPPSLHFENPNPSLRLEGSPFAVQGAAGPWRAGPRRAGVSSFGIGGTNVHVVLEQGPDATHAATSLPVQLLPLSADTPAALRRSAEALAEQLRRPDAPPLSAVASSLQGGRRTFRRRLAVVAATPAEAAERLGDLAEGLEAGDAAPPVFLFPGQGTQHAGMANALKALPGFAEPLAEALDGLAARGVCLRPLLDARRDDAEANRRLAETELAQPAIFAVEYALARCFIALGIRPAACLGHSLGEVTAACIAGVLDLDTALSLVIARGRLMQAMPPGRMLSVRVGEAALRPLLPPGVAIAALNAPDLTAIAGPAEAIEQAAAAIAAAGGLCRPLRSTRAFHSPMMHPVEAPFREAVAALSLRAPTLPLVGNLSGTWLGAEVGTPDYWARQVSAPVRFADGIATLLAAGHRRFVELGPHGGLATLAARQDPQARCWTALAPASDDGDLRALLRTLGGLWTAGLQPDWTALWPSGRPPRVALPPYPFERERHWVDAPGASRQAAVVPDAEVAEAAAPAEQGDAERAVIALWREHLGHAAIGADDDFSRLGGDSLLAVQLAAALNRRFHTALQPHDLLRYATPRSLAARLLRREKIGGVAPFARVTLREGEPGTAPLVLFHAVGGTINLYAELVAALPGELPVVAFQSPSLAGGGAGPRTVEAMARDYLADLMPLQPHGPYRLVGASFGGMLAFEAARQLVQRGESVTLLALLDTPGPGQLPRDFADDAEVLSYIARILGRPVEAGPLRALDAAARLERFVASVGDRLPPGMTAAAFAVYLEAFKRNTEAMRAYDPRGVAGLPKLLFLKAAVRDADTASMPERAWQALLGEAAVEVAAVPGTHLSMLQGANAIGLAERLAPLLV